MRFLKSKKVDGTIAGGMGTLRLLLACVAMTIGFWAMTRPTVAQAVPALAQNDPITDRSSYRLTDGEWDVLWQIQQQCYEVACGNRTSTTFGVDAAKLLGQDEWTEEDYGEPPAGTVQMGWGDEVLVSWKLKSDVENRLWESLERIIYVLRYEKPSITEWLREDGRNRISVEWDAELVDGKWHARIASAEFECAIVPCFGGDGEVDPDAMQGFRDCLPLAQEIAERHAGEPAHERMVSYHNEIRDLSSYDDWADDTGYEGDARPWSIVSVFDGDPSTRSVCVAYSRALSLLVELSGDDDMQCRTALGYAATRTVRGAHMWNIVRMPDGRNYLSDVTNCAPGAVGAGQLHYAPAYGSPDESYTVEFANSFITFTNSERTLDVCSWDALEISDVPYAPPAPQIEAPSAEENPVIRTTAPVEEERVEATEEPREWDIPLTNETYPISFSTEDMRKGSVAAEVENASWVFPVIAFLLGVAITLLIPLLFMLVSKILPSGKVIAVAIAGMASLLVACSPTDAQAAPALAPIEDRASYTLDDEEWEALWQIQQQCHEVTYGNRTSTTFDLDIAGMLGKNEWAVDGQGRIRWGEDEEEDASEFGTRVKGYVQYLAHRAFSVLACERPSIVEWMRRADFYCVDCETSSYERDGQRYVCVSSAKVSSSVRPEYVGGSDYEVREDSLRLIRASLERAQGIVERHAGEPVATRLDSYKNEIYGLTSYAYGTTASEYGPRGFVSVFDGDPSTGSVCEGYSKALKLLVELSGETDVLCHTMTGTLVSSNGQSPHMWNAIRMPDGKNYMTDLTNNQPGVAGDGMAFLSASYATEDGGYQVPMIGQTACYRYNELTEEIYQPEALLLSDTPYEQPVRPVEQPVVPEQPIVANDTTPEPVVQQDEKPLQDEAKREWTIPIADNRETIAISQDDMGEMPKAETPRWLLPAILLALVVALFATLLLVLF